MPPTTSLIEVHVPQENVNDDAVTINRWLIKDGAKVEKDQPLVEVETSKADFEIPAPAAGFVKHLAKEGADVPVGAAICLIAENVESFANAPAPSAAPAKTESTPLVAAAIAATNGTAHATEKLSAPPMTCAPTRFSQAANALLKEHNLAESTFQNRGLITAHDILTHLGKVPCVTPVAKTACETPTEKSRTSPTPSMGVPVKIEKLARSKQMEVRYLRSSHDNVIPSTVCVTARSTRPRGEADSFSSIILFETARLLKKYPLFNAFYAEAHAHLYQDINVGFAIDIGEGLKVAIIKNADKKSLADIQSEQRELVVSVLSGELRPESLSGGTFTITDLSAESVSTFIPLINQGQSAILGIGAIDPRTATYQLILTFDHQLSEGRSAALFLNELKHRLEAHDQYLAAEHEKLLPPPPPAPEVACYRCGTNIKALAQGHFMLTGYPRNGKKAEPICTVCVQDF